MDIRHDAFISYNHRADTALAKALEAGMEKLAKPLLSLRAIDVFRDETGMAANPDLWAGILDHLNGAKWLVVLACPEWAESHWCRREILWWLENHRAARILIVLVGGQLQWDRARGDFDWSVTTALSSDLRGRFKEEPLYVDLRWARGRDGLTLRNLGFRDAVLSLSAAIRDVPKDQLDGADVRQLRRNRWLVRSGVTAIVILAMAAVWQAIVATQQRDEAVRQARLAKSRELAAASRFEQRRDSDLSILLAEAALQTSVTSEALSAAREALQASPLRMILRGHTPGLTDAGFSPDGRQVITAGLDKTARIWDVATGSVLHVLSGHSASVTRATFSPRGNYVLTASEDGSSRIWQPDGQPVCADAFRHQRGIRHANISPDETQVATAGLDRTARLWDVKSCLRLAEVAHSDAIAHVSFSLQGNRLLTSGYDETTSVWDISRIRDGEAPSRLATLRHRGTNFAAFSPDGSKVASAGLDAAPVLWEIGGTDPTGKPLGRLRVNGARVAFSPDGKHVAIAGIRPAAQVFEVATGRLHGEWSESFEDLDPNDAGNPGEPQAMFSPDGTWLLTTLGTTIRIWDVNSGRRIALLRHAARVRTASFSPDGARVISAGSGDAARIWQVSSAQQVARLGEAGQPVEDATFSADGRLLAEATRQDGVRLWDLAKPDSARVLSLERRAFQSVAFSSDGRFIVAATTPYAQVWNLGSGEPHKTLQPDAIVEGINHPQFSPDRTRVIAGSATSAKIWNLDTGRSVLEMRGHTNAVGHAAFRPDGKQAVTGSQDKTARIWDLASGQTVRILSGHGEPVSFVAFSPDGGRVVTASWDGTGRVWDAATGVLLAVLAGHSRSLRYAAFSPDGLWVVTMSDDDTVRVWDAAYGHELARYWSSADRLLATAFMPDSRRVIAFAQSRKVVVLACELCVVTPSLLQLAGQRAFRPPTAAETERFRLGMP